MQPTNNSTEEDRNMLMALELYRLQSLRNMLLVILLIQLLLIAIGLTLVFRATRPAPFPVHSSPDDSTTAPGHNRLLPGENDRSLEMVNLKPFPLPPHGERGPYRVKPLSCYWGNCFLTPA